MSRFQDSEEGMYTLMGMCLLMVQSAERGLEMALETVFSDKAMRRTTKMEILEGSKATLGFLAGKVRIIWPWSSTIAHTPTTLWAITTMRSLTTIKPPG
jgi:hypothetical protein